MYIIPSATSIAEYIYPLWVEIFAIISIAIVIISIIILMLNIAAWLWDIQNELIFRLASTALILGCILFLISIVLLAITGVKVE